LNERRLTILNYAGNPLPLPPHYDPKKVSLVWRVPYQERAPQATQWAGLHQIKPAASDTFKLALLLVDVQNTFCIPGYELFVAGHSGMGAVEDNQRLCEFIYHNLGILTYITATMDTHLAMQIFHPLFLVDENGEHPAPLSTISAEQVKQGLWKFNPDLAPSLGISVDYGQKQLLHYVEGLKASQKYDLTIWPYHAMLGGVGHALVSSIEEALFFHTVARSSQTDYEIKGDNPLTEHYSVLRPEVTDDPFGKQIGNENKKFIRMLERFDIVAIAGQAKSHCVSWTIADLLAEIRQTDDSLAHKVYILEDCMSSVVVPGVVDYSLQADKTFEGFARAGMHLVHSDQPVKSWPG
jgi:nicotinamidase-related amidase